ncbi:hypothetical protein [Streptomyces sp. NPDC094468]
MKTGAHTPPPAPVLDHADADATTLGSSNEGYREQVGWERY